MDIYHWWLIKMVAIQLLCLMGVVWGFRYLRQNRLAMARIQKSAPLRETNSAPDGVFQN